MVAGKAFCRDCVIKRARWPRAVARAEQCGFGEFELRVAVAVGNVAADDRVPATRHRRVGPGDVDALDFDTTLNGANAKRNLILGWWRYLGHRLCLEHLGRLGLLALVDLAVLAKPVAVVYDFHEAEKNCDNLGRLVGSGNAAWV